MRVEQVEGIIDSGMSLYSRLLRAIDEVKAFDDVNISVAHKSKALRKFGRSTAIDNTGYKTIWDHSGDAEHETLLTSNGITHVSSSSGSDTMDLRIEGHTISGTDLTFVVQTVTVTGQTAAALDTALARCTRVQVQGTTANVGDLYVHEGGAQTNGVPDTASEVHAKVPIGQDQTRKAATAVSSVDYWLITRVFATVNRQQAASVDIVLETKSTTGVWTPTFAEIGLASSGLSAFQLDLDPVLIVPSNHDVRLVARGSSASDTTVSASMAGYLAAAF